MGKTVEEICNNFINAGMNLNQPNEIVERSLSDCIKCNNLEYNSVLYNYDGLYNTLEHSIAQKLALAIDENDVFKIKKLKEQFGDTKEFSHAKKFLNQKCKEVWNVYTTLKKVPKEAMKILGITNQPDLDFLLKDCLNYHEKDCGNITVLAISSILKNKNMSYEIEDIYEYLVQMHKKFNYNYNFVTIAYFIKEHNYSKDKLHKLGANETTIKKALKTLSIKVRLSFFFNFNKSYI